MIGLVGGIGSGKSRVAAEFAKRGARVLSADEFGHEALRQPDIRRQLVQRWGDQILGEDREIVRPRVGAIVFADADERRFLESVVHPWIGRRLREAIEAAKADATVPLVVLDAAIMLEAGWNNACDRLVYVDASRDVRLRRVAQQRGWTAQEEEARERAQLPLPEKEARADAVVDNSGPPDLLARQVEDLLLRWGVQTPD